MSYSLIYLAHRLIFRVVDFFHHWYVDGSRSLFHWFISMLAGLDETFAVRLTFRHILEPLYKDYSIPGHVFGIVFRTGRIIIGSALYLVFGVFFLTFYIAWLAVPLAMLFFVYDNLPK